MKGEWVIRVIIYLDIIDWWNNTMDGSIYVGRIGIEVPHYSRVGVLLSIVQLLARRTIQSWLPLVVIMVVN